jgi:glycerophosphoryl diester phosphodiesterase
MTAPNTIDTGNTPCLPNWPYPRHIAHRGAGKLAPENSLAAIRLGASHGYRMFECDVKLSADGVPFLLHDSTLQRTTNAARAIGAGQSAVAGDHAWEALALLDAGSWHSETYAGEPLPTLNAVAALCRAHDLMVNLEIKPSPGSAHHTGAVVAQQAARLWQGQPIQPLLTSFEVEALEGAVAAQPGLPYGLLLDTLWSGWLETALSLGCQVIVCKHSLWDKSSVTQAKSAGFKTLSYTVNDASTAQRLWDLGIDGIITDRVDLFTPAP